MESGDRLESLKAIFEKVDADKAAVISQLLQQVVFMEQPCEFYHKAEDK